MSDLLVDVASAGSGLEAFDLLSNEIDKGVIPDMSVSLDILPNLPASSITPEMYAGAVKQLQEINPSLDIEITGLRAYGVINQPNGGVDKIDGLSIGALIPFVRNGKTMEVINSERNARNAALNKKTARNKSKEVDKKEREHIRVANVILEIVKKSEKWRLIQKPFYKMTNSERGDFKRAFGDTISADKFKKQMQFIEKMAKEDRLITRKQKDYLSSIANDYRVSFDKNADKESTRTLAKDKINLTNRGDYEDSDMPEYDEKTGKWYDMETGLEINPPKSRFAGKSYF